MLIGGQHGRQIGEDLVQLLAVGPRLEGRVLGSLQLRCRHELHRTGDLLDVLDRADAASDLALAGHELVGASCVSLLRAGWLDHWIDGAVVTASVRP